MTKIADQAEIEQHRAAEARLERICADRETLFNEHMEREAFRRLGQLLGEINDDILVADDRDRLIDEARD